MKKSAAIAATKRAALIERAVRLLPERDLQHLRHLVLEAGISAIMAASKCERCYEALARTRAIYRQLHAEIYP